MIAFDRRIETGSALYTLTLRDIPRGRFEGSGIVETSLGTTRFHFRGEKVGHFACCDRVIVSKGGADDAEWVKDIQFRHANGEKLVIQAIESDTQAINFRVVEIATLASKSKVNVVARRLAENAPSKTRLRLLTSIDPEPVVFDWYFLCTESYMPPRGP